MKNLQYLMMLIISALIISCETAIPSKISNSEDYNQFFNIKNKSLEFAQNEYFFWEQKLKDTPNQFLYLSKIAAANSMKFKATGEITFLIEAEENLILLNEKSNYNKASYLRSLARNNISQHKFKNALEYLKKAELIGENLNATQSMLFDVYLELGNIIQAKYYLDEIENFNDFNYLIRLSKYSDHRGDLGAAIMYLERAKSIAENSKNKNLLQWTYTNLADFYGHASKIEDSYQYYLKALQIDPNDAYAKKGIAWIVYSYERNPKEALRILNEISKEHMAPDYFLIKAEIADYLGNSEVKNYNLNTYNNLVKNSQYGNMYNKYNCMLYAEDVNTIENALQIAKNEINERPTAQSFDLLAWVYFQKKDYKMALEVIENEVVNKTFEPEILYHNAQIFKANGKEDKVKKLKKELLKSIYELGPIMEQKINTL